MGFTYSVYLPGFNKTVWAREIAYKDYKDLVKSLYNKDESSFIIHSNNVIEQIVPGILYSGLTVVDKLILLVNARAVSVGPDLKLKANCKDTKNEFEYTVQLDTIFNTLSNLKYSATTTYKNITVEYSIVKARDEVHFLEKNPELLFVYQLASCIDKIKTNGIVLNFNEIDFEKRCELVDKLPAQLNNTIIQNLLDTESALAKNKLILIRSPFTNNEVVDMPLSTDTNILLQFSKLLFTDDLNNLYQLTYNLISKLHMQGSYIDNLTLAELYLFWSLYLQEVQRNEQDNSPNNGMMYQGTKSEFTS